MKSHSEKTHTNSPVSEKASDAPFFDKSGENGFFSTKQRPDNFIQRQHSSTPNKPKTIEEINQAAFGVILSEWAAEYKILDPMVRQLAKSYSSRKNLSNIALPDREVSNTPYGGNKVIHGFKPPSEERIYQAIFPRIKLKKIGKGNDIKDWTFTWKDNSNNRSKTHDEKIQDIGMWKANDLADKVMDIAIKNESKIAKTVAKVGVELALERGMITTVLLATGAGEIIGTAIAIYGLAELLLGFDDLVEKDISPQEQESEDIVEGVKRYLQNQSDSTDAKKNFGKAPAMTSDRLSPRSKFIPPSE